MPIVKLWNKNHLDYSEEFEGEKITIQANRFILMDKEKAYKFKGQYAPIELDGGGVQKADSFKMLAVEDTSKGEIAKMEKFRCAGCNFVGMDAGDLDSHVNDYHLDQLIDKDEYKKRMKAVK